MYCAMSKMKSPLLYVLIVRFSSIVCHGCLFHFYIFLNCIISLVLVNFFLPFLQDFLNAFIYVLIFFFGACFPIDCANVFASASIYASNQICCCVAD